MQGRSLILLMNETLLNKAHSLIKNNIGIFIDKF
jgi:hypothetical protein